MLSSDHYLIIITFLTGLLSILLVKHFIKLNKNNILKYIYLIKIFDNMSTFWIIIYRIYIYIFFENFIINISI